MNKSKTDAAKARLTADTPRTPPVPDADWLSSGLTLLNLAATGHPDRCVPKGKYAYVVGDSSSGKTWFAFTFMAEAARNKNFDGYRFVHDNAEHGALMDVGRYFGRKLEATLEPPRRDKKTKEPVYSSTVEEFYYNLAAALDRGPCVYVLDSMDALSADEDEKHFVEERRAFEQGKKTAGSYGMAKARYNNRHINTAVSKLRKTGSVLIMISQTRDKVGGTIPGQKTRSGGKGLRFFNRFEFWTSVRGPIKKRALGKDREVGSLIQIDVQKNHFNGWEGKVPLVPFYRQTGMDDVGACVDFLIDEGRWDKTDSGVIDATDLGFTGKREDLIATIQDEDRDRELQLLTARVWREIEEACRVLRKPRYT